MYIFLGTSQDAEHRQQTVVVDIFSSIQKTDEEKYFRNKQGEGRKCVSFAVQNVIKTKSLFQD